MTYEQFVGLWVLGFLAMPDILAFMNAGFKGWENLLHDRWLRYTGNLYHTGVTLMCLLIVSVGLWANGWHRLNTVLLLMCVVRVIAAFTLRPRQRT
jgi:hypothetical protein